MKRDHLSYGSETGLIRIVKNVLRKTSFHSNLIFIFSLAFVLRLYFYSGMVFSDDAYYAGYALSESGIFFGYPVIPLRIGQYFFTSAAISIFGKSEVSTIIFPFLFSLLSLFVIYQITLILSKKKIPAIIAAFILAIFPIDVIFATINFVDLQSAFFIGLGLLLLLLAVTNGSDYYAFFSGLAFFIALLFKSVVFFILPALIIITVFLWHKKNNSYRYIVISLIVLLGGVLTEGLFYLFIKGNFFHRFTVLAANYEFAWYNFFPFTIPEEIQKSSPVIQVLYQISLNLKYILLRRFFLFIPLISLIIALLMIYWRKAKSVHFYYIILLLSLAALPTGLQSYNPLDLRFSWYSYVLFVPAIIILASFLAEQKNIFVYPILILVFIVSLFMAQSYNNYFDVGNKAEFKKYLEKLEGIVITDHHTAYGIQLFNRAEKLKIVFLTQNEVLDDNNSFENLRGMDFADKKIYLIKSLPKIRELRRQGFSINPLFPGRITESPILAQIGEFEIYIVNPDLFKK